MDEIKDVIPKLRKNAAKDRSVELECSIDLVNRSDAILNRDALWFIQDKELA